MLSYNISCSSIPVEPANMYIHLYRFLSILCMKKAIFLFHTTSIKAYFTRFSTKMLFHDTSTNACIIRRPKNTYRFILLPQRSAISSTRILSSMHTCQSDFHSARTCSTLPRKPYRLHFLPLCILRGSRSKYKRKNTYQKTDTSSTS
jgi:hypothetical protein